jgi:hypothetical protein
MSPKWRRPPILFALLMCGLAIPLTVERPVAATANAADLSFPYEATLGVGRAPCSQYNLNLRTNGVERERDVAWILGFASGHNFFRTVPKYKPVFSYYDAENLVRQIDNECSKRPDSLLVVVTYDFIRKLMMQSPKAN